MARGWGEGAWAPTRRRLGPPGGWPALESCNELVPEQPPWVEHIYPSSRPVPLAACLLLICSPGTQTAGGTEVGREARGAVSLPGVTSSCPFRRWRNTLPRRAVQHRVILRDRSDLAKWLFSLQPPVCSGAVRSCLFARLSGEMLRPTRSGHLLRGLPRHLETLSLICLSFQHRRL